MESFSTELLLQSLREWAPARRYWVAYSGGVDSHVLLHALTRLAGQLPGALSAIHIDHGINPASGIWAQHCERICSAMDVPLVVQRIEVRARHGVSPEAAARRLRYLAFREHVGDGEMLLTAHQQDDQAETLLLQLCRGAGPAGLSGMPGFRTFGRGWHARPLLPFSRQCIATYAGQHALEWIEDTSNRDTRFERNFLRQEIMPRLQLRRPGLAAVLSRAAAIQAEASGLLSEMAAGDLLACCAGAEDVLDIDRLLHHSPARRFNLVHYWLNQLGLPLPGAALLHRIQAEVIGARPDSSPCLAWPGAEVRRYRRLLFARPPLAPHNPLQVHSWRLEEPCDLADGTLTAGPGRDGGIRRSACPGGTLEVRFRRGGERLQPAGSAHRRELKTLFQERGVPPWLRDRVPLLYIDSHLAAAADWWIDKEFAAAPGENAWQLRWTGATKAPGSSTGPAG